MKLGRKALMEKLPATRFSATTLFTLTGLVYSSFARGTWVPLCFIEIFVVNLAIEKYKILYKYN